MDTEGLKQILDRFDSIDNILDEQASKLQEYNKAAITDRCDVIEAKLEDTVNAQKASAMQLSEHGVEIAMLRNDYGMKS